jgi:polysaccharide biosynthesis/export protein
MGALDTPPSPLFGSSNPQTKGEKGIIGEQTRYIHPANKAELVDNSLLPKELNKVTMPPYTVEAPDILLIDAQRLIPLPPYRLQPQDALAVSAPGAPVDDPINNIFPIDPDGSVNLGSSYGTLQVADLTVPEVEKLLTERVKKFGFKNTNVTVSLAQSRGLQQIRGEHLVRPDGTVFLGLYGSVYVAGMNLPQIKQAIEAHLSKSVYRPEVSVDVSAYNSKYYYVITDYAGNGEQVTRVPATGNETVLDAVSVVGGLSPVSSKTIWIARPAPAGSGDQILRVDWKGITRRGSTTTNYQVLPGDRVFVMGQPLAKFDNGLARVSAPIERVLGTSLFGYTTVRTIQTGGLGLGNTGQTTVNVAR